MECDNLVKTLEGIEELTKDMMAAPHDDRIGVFKRIDQLVLRLEGYLTRCPDGRASEKLEELKMHLILIAHLDDSDEFTDEGHCEAALAAVADLRSLECFR